MSIIVKLQKYVYVINNMRVHNVEKYLITPENNFKNIF